MTLAGLRPIGSPAPAATPGVCRVCGCTDEEPCMERGDAELVRGAIVFHPCRWVEPDLCSRCHGPRRPTRGQAGEISRIRSRLGPVLVQRGPLAGSLRVTLAGDPPPTAAAAELGELDARVLIARIQRGEWWPGRTITLDATGHPYVAR